MKNKNHFSNCTTFFSNFQLFLPMDIGVNIPKSAPVRVISKLLEGLDYRNLMQAYSKNKGRRHKIEANKIELEHIAFELDKMLHQVSNLFIYEAQNKGIDLDCNKLCQPITPNPTALSSLTKFKTLCRNGFFHSGLCNNFSSY